MRPTRIRDKVMKKTIIIALVLGMVSMVSHAQVFIPYNLLPNVAVEQAAQIINNQMQQEISHFWDNVDINSLQTPSAPINVPAPSMSFDDTSTRGYSSSYEPRTPRTSQHDRCTGTGKCNTCNGTGMMWSGNIKKRCVNCSGSGRCSGCNGTGRTSPHYY